MPKLASKRIQNFVNFVISTIMFQEPGGGGEGSCTVWLIWQVIPHLALQYTGHVCDLGHVFWGYTSRQYCITKDNMGSHRIQIKNNSISLFSSTVRLTTQVFSLLLCLMQAQASLLLKTAIRQRLRWSEPSCPPSSPICTFWASVWGFYFYSAGRIALICFVPSMCDHW